MSYISWKVYYNNGVGAGASNKFLVGIPPLK